MESFSTKTANYNDSCDHGHVDMQALNLSFTKASLHSYKQYKETTPCTKINSESQQTFMCSHHIELVCCNRSGSTVSLRHETTLIFKFLEQLQANAY